MSADLSHALSNAIADRLAELEELANKAFRDMPDATPDEVSGGISDVRGKIDAKLGDLTETRKMINSAITRIKVWTRRTKEADQTEKAEFQGVIQNTRALLQKWQGDLIRQQEEHTMLLKAVSPSLLYLTDKSY